MKDKLKTVIIEKHKEMAMIDLTDRQQEYLELLLQGKSNKEIARALYVSERTVANVVRHLFSLYDVGNRIELMNKYREAKRTSLRIVVNKKDLFSLIYFCLREKISFEVIPIDENFVYILFRNKEEKEKVENFKEVTNEIQ